MYCRLCRGLFDGPILKSLQVRDLLHFTRVALNSPVLDRKGLEGCLNLMELLVLWATENQVPGIGRRLDRLRVDVISRQLPHPYWVDWAIGKEKFFSKPDKGYVIPQWVKEEVGVSRVLTVAAALMPRKPGINVISFLVRRLLVNPNTSWTAVTMVVN